MRIEEMDLAQFADFLGVLVPLAHEMAGGDEIESEVNRNLEVVNVK